MSPGADSSSTLWGLYVFQYFQCRGDTVGPAITSSVLTAPRSRTRVSSRGQSVWTKPLALPMRAGESAQRGSGCCQGSDWLLNMRPDLKASEGFKLCLLKMSVLCCSVCVSVHAICLLRQKRRPGWRGRGLENCFDCCRASERPGRARGLCPYTGVTVSTSQPGALDPVAF